MSAACIINVKTPTAIILTGRKLDNHLTLYSFPKLVKDMKKYIQAVQAYHFKCSALALEILPIFRSMNSQLLRVKE